MLKSYALADNKIVDASGLEAPILLFVSPDEFEQRQLIDGFAVDEHTLTSALDPDEPPRFEIEPHHIALIFKRPRNYSAAEKFLFKVTSMGLFLFKDRLIVVMSEEVPILTGKSFSNVESLEELFLKILSISIHHYLEHLKVITQITEEIEGLIGSSMENRYLLNLFSLEKSLVYYLSAINSNGFTLERLKSSAAKLALTEKSFEFLDDLIIENTQSYRQAEIYSNILASLMDARVSIVSNNLNILMKTLNLVTIVIMVPT
ncbi:MAG: magnesium transporter CorA family protein, partial [Candidatus Omnitrophota bacterium]